MSGPTDPVEAHFDKGTWGFDGTVWRKQPLLFGYSDTVQEAVEDLNPPGTYKMLTTTPVPAGQVHVLNSMALTDNTSVADTLSIAAHKGGLGIPFLVQTSPAAAVWEIWEGHLVLKEGDYVEAHFEGITIGDDLYFRVQGYMVRIGL